MTDPYPPRPSPSLLAAYNATLFEVLTTPAAALLVGGQGPLVGDWLLGVGANSAVIITAWNPFSRSTEQAANEQKQAQLLAEVEAAGLQWLPAQGRDAAGVWPPEPSLCVLDASLILIDRWLANFEQFAAVTIDPINGCQLRWHPGVDMNTIAAPIGPGC